MHRLWWLAYASCTAQERSTKMGSHLRLDQCSNRGGSSSHHASSAGLKELLSRYGDSLMWQRISWRRSACCQKRCATRRTHCTPPTSYLDTGTCLRLLQPWSLDGIIQSLFANLTRMQAAMSSFHTFALRSQATKIPRSIEFRTETLPRSGAGTRAKESWSTRDRGADTFLAFGRAFNSPRLLIEAENQDVLFFQNLFLHDR